MQVGLLVLALTLPGFQVRQVTVVGTHLITTGAVVAAAEVPEQSIFTINGAAIQGRVQALPWVASAVVTTELPATVRISVVERSPMLRIRRDGTDTLVASDGATLPGVDATPAARTGIPVLIDDRAGSPQAVNPTLVELLSSIAQRFHAGVRLLGGRVPLGERRRHQPLDEHGMARRPRPPRHPGFARALPAQIETLAALKGRMNFVKPNFGYIDVEAPPYPVSGGHPGLPAEVSAALLPGRPCDPAGAGGVLRRAADGAAHAASDADPDTGDERQPDLGHRR